MKIGELARLTSCSAQTIRYYEEEGLLPEPDRTAGNYRDYGQEHLERLRLIRNCRNLDMGHDEIKSLLHFVDNPEENCQGVNEVLSLHIAHVRERIAELELLHGQLTALRQKCRAADSASACPILHDLGEAALKSPGGKNHMHGR
jgi:Cd(II)/Pb(II)-responsive transcriptional regulator